MRHLSLPIALCFTVACAGSQSARVPAEKAERQDAHQSEAPAEGAGPTGAAGAPGDETGNEFKLGTSETARTAHGATASKIKATRTEAAMKFVVLDKETGPIAGVVVKMTDPAGNTFYTEETDKEGYAEVLVPVGRKYDLTYLSLGRRDIAAQVPVGDKPSQTIKLTLRYKNLRPPPLPDKPDEPAPPPRFVLQGVEFDTGKATIRSDSFPQLDLVVEYMTHKKSARIEISGHTDNVGNARTNKNLSEKRAQAVREYLGAKGIDMGRIQAVGFGDERPIAPNDTDEGRQKNRRIEATEL